jgi:FkbM family methyltransferase
VQKNVFSFQGRRIELWTHPEPDHLATLIRRTGHFYEPDVLAKIHEIYLPGTIVVDVGANIGNHTVFFAAILGAPVVAIEPYAPNHDVLQLNIAANGLETLVHTHCLALGDRDGSGSARIGDPGNLGTVGVSAGAGDIPIRSLDGMRLDQPVGLIKIDVEGGEAAVLAGARHTIRRWFPDIMVEADGPDRFLATARQLHALGYVPRGRYAWTPTYLFSAVDQAARMASLLHPVARAA